MPELTIMPIALMGAVPPDNQNYKGVIYARKTTTCTYV